MGLKLHLGKYLQHAFDFFIAPPFCAYCKIFLSERAIFCERCLALIRPIVSTDVTVNKTYSMRIFAISDYQEPLKNLIVAKSWSDIVASQQLGQLIWEMSYFKYQPCDILVPVPLHWMRAAKRGFNQAEIIAQTLAKNKGCAVKNVIHRIKQTPFQSALAVVDRAANVSDAFKATDACNVITGKHIFIVDDLMTTGATLKAVAKELSHYKPASISAVVACRVV